MLHWNVGIYTNLISVNVLTEQREMGTLPPVWAPSQYSDLFALAAFERLYAVSVQHKNNRKKTKTGTPTLGNRLGLAFAFCI